MKNGRSIWFKKKTRKKEKRMEYIDRKNKMTLKVDHSLKIIYLVR